MPRTVARRNGGARLTPYQLASIVRGGGRALSEGYKMLKQSRQSRSAAPAVAASSEPLTGQFDFKTDYKKRRLSKYQRRRQFKRRKRAGKARTRAKLSAANTTHIVKRSAFTLSSAASQSSAVSYGLYGIDGYNGQFNSTADVGDLFNEMDSASWTNANNLVTSSINNRLYFQHGVMELTVRNTGTNDAILEAYFIRGRRFLVSAWLSPADVYDKGFSRQALAANPNPAADPNFETELTFTTVGTTPFQNSMFCRSFLIYKRQKFRIPPGSEVNIVLNDRRPRTFTEVGSKGVAMDRRFHGILFQQQGGPADGVPVVTAQATTLTYVAVRRYRMKMVRDALSTDAFDTSAVV